METPSKVHPINGNPAFSGLINEIDQHADSPLQRSILRAQSIVQMFKHRRNARTEGFPMSPYTPSKRILDDEVCISTPSKSLQKPGEHEIKHIVEEQKELLSMMENQIQTLVEKRAKFDQERENLELRYKDLQTMENKTCQELQVFKEQIMIVDELASEMCKESDVEVEEERTLKKRRSSAIEGIDKIVNEVDRRNSLGTSRKSLGLPDLISFDNEEAIIVKNLGRRMTLDIGAASNEEILQLVSQLDELRNEKELGDRQVDALRNSLQLKDNEMETLRTELAQRDEVIAKIRQESTQYETELTSLRKELQRVQVELDLAQAEAEEQLRSEYGSKLKELSVKYQSECSLRKELYNKLQEVKGNIRVICRVRALSETEHSQQQLAITNNTVDSSMMIDFPSENALRINKKKFEFDKVFDSSFDQPSIFQEVQPLVTSVMDGFNVCIFAYGQTGSGKTYTMEGTEDNRGVNYRSIDELFRLVKDRSSSHLYAIQLSMLEIYNEQIRDLLSSSLDPSSDKLEIKLTPNGTTHVPDLTSVEVKTTEEAWTWMRFGNTNRVTGITDCNERSSRSHCVVSFTITGENIHSGLKSQAKLTLVDLAGSERINRSGVVGERLKEAQHINKSLSALGNVVAGLVAKNSHIPYRDSKLTFLLKDSLGGDSKTLMFVQVSPVYLSNSETVTSLTFAARVRNVELGPAKQNTEDTTVQKYKDQAKKAVEAAKLKEKVIEELQEQLKQADDKYTKLDHLYNQLSERMLKKERDLPPRNEPAIKKTAPISITLPVDNFASLPITDKSIVAPMHSSQFAKPIISKKERFTFLSPERSSCSNEDNLVDQTKAISPVPIDLGLGKQTAVNLAEDKDDVYNTWKDHVKEILSFDDTPTVAATLKENIDANIPEKRIILKTVRFADSPKNKPSLVLKRKTTAPAVPDSLPSPTQTRPAKRIMTRQQTKNIPSTVAPQIAASPFADRNQGSWLRSLRGTASSASNNCPGSLKKPARRIQIRNSPNKKKRVEGAE